MRLARGIQFVAAVLVGSIFYFAAARDAWAVPSFARKYQTSCQTCHTVYPAPVTQTVVVADGDVTMTFDLHR